MQHNFIISPLIHNSSQISIYNKPNIGFVDQHHISLLGSDTEIPRSIQNQISVSHSN
jgi:hypothetical protein